MPRYGSHPRISVRADWKKFAASFSEALGDVGEQLTNFGKMKLSDSCKEWIRNTDSEWPHSTLITRPGKFSNVVQQSFGGDRFHPWYYGQLHDSIAVRIAEKNRTVAIHYMPASATKPQHATAEDAGMRYDNIVGAEFAVREAHNAEYYFLRGIQMQLIVGVPYARKVNESTRHAGFLNVLNADFFSYIEECVQDVIGDSPTNRTRIFRPKKK